MEDNPRVNKVNNNSRRTIVLAFMVTALGSLLMGCGGASIATISQAIEHRLANKNWNYILTDKCLSMVPHLSNWKELLNNKIFIVIFQNNNEIRASGGFMGSYARIRTDARGIAEIKIHDIYEPDGQIRGHVDPPYPIQEAFSQGWWRLRDANWEIDFAKSGEIIKWFFEQGGEDGVDGIIAINVGLMKKILEETGGVELVTYPEKVDASNLDELAQKYAQDKKDKRGFLGAAGTAIVERVKGSGKREQIGIAKKALEEIQKGEVVMWSEDKNWQKTIDELGWSGRLDKGWKAGEGYIYIVESNLGSNKANCCIERWVEQEIEGEAGRVRMKWKNNNLGTETETLAKWGGDYVNYVRIVIPKDQTVLELRVGGKKLRWSRPDEWGIPNALRQGLSEDIYVIEQEGEFQIVGFWAEVGSGEELMAEMVYEGRPRSSAMTVKHQPGIGVVPYVLKVDGKVVADSRLERDTRFVWIKSRK